MVLNSNIIKDYIYTPSVIKYVDDGRTLTPQITDDIVLNNYFNHTPNETYSGKTQLNFLKGSYYNDNYYYISYNVEIKTKKFKNILQEDVLNSDGGSLTLTFFIYEKIVVDKTVKANYIHPKQDMYMYDYLGYYNKNQGFADLQIVMTNEELWKYTQKYVVGEDEYSVNWKHNLGESVTNVVVFSNRDDATVTATFNKYGDSLQYTVVITAEIKQFNKTIPLTWEVLVLKPNITDEIRITSSAPRFNKISSKSAVTNSGEPFTNNIFEYDLDLQEGDKFTITADQFSNGGEVSQKGLTLVVTNSAGTTMYDVVGVDGNTIEVKRIQAGVKLIVFATDILSTDVYRYSAGFERPEQYIMEAESPNETKYMGSYFIINLHLEDGKTKETAYSVYNLSDFEQMMNETSGKWYRIMNDINLKGLKSFNKDFIGNVYGYHADCTLFDLELNATNKNLFKTFTGTMENICFETNYNYDSSTTIGNLGIIGTLNDGEILKYVKTIVSGESELNNPANEYNFGLLVGENKGTIAYYDKVEAGKYVGRKVAAVSGRFILKGESSVKFGGIAGVNSGNASIIGENYNESDLSSLSQEITFATEAEQQGALVNINLVADEFENANSYVGGIVGENCGKLSNAYVTGVINAPNVSNVGGVVGCMNKTKTGEYNRFISGIYANEVSYSGTEVADIEHVKSSVVITGKDNVGGIVGKGEYGLYKYCWYQILPTTSVAISGHNNVGGIVGNAMHSKLQFCSVFSYKYDYADNDKYLLSLKNKDSSEKPADIIGKNYVAGLIGFAQNANLAPDNAKVTNSTIVRNSSVNAVIDMLEGSIYFGITTDNTGKIIDYEITLDNFTFEPESDMKVEFSAKINLMPGTRLSLDFSEMVEKVKNTTVYPEQDDSVEYDYDSHGGWNETVNYNGQGYIAVTKNVYLYVTEVYRSKAVVSAYDGVSCNGYNSLMLVYPSHRWDVNFRYYEFKVDGETVILLRSDRTGEQIAITQNDDAYVVTYADGSSVTVSKDEETNYRDVLPETWWNDYGNMSDEYLIYNPTTDDISDSYKLHDYELDESLSVESVGCTKGYDTYVCSICSDVVKHQYTAADHSYVIDYDNTVVADACDQMSKYVFKCTACGDSYEKSVYRGHNYVTSYDLKPGAVDCQGGVIRTRICDDCNYNGGSSYYYGH